MTSNAIQRAQGRWARGVSGNPAGRPAGRQNKNTVYLQQLLAGRAEEVIRAVSDAAVAGDMRAAALVLERVYPKRHCRPLEGLSLPTISTVADACKAMAAITSAVLAGVLSAEEGAHLSAIVETYRRTIEVAEVVARVERLERLQAPKSPTSKRLVAE